MVEATMHDNSVGNLDFPDIWLLEAVVQFPAPVRLLNLAPADMPKFWNRPSHNMTAPQLNRKLCKLFERGLIQFRRHGTLVDCSAKALESELAKGGRSVGGKVTEADMSWSLTLLGGAKWEQTALADWGKYYSQDWKSDENVRITANSCERLLNIREAYLGFANERREDRIDVTVQRPWQATYWKRLPQGFSATFTTAPDSMPRWDLIESWHIPSHSFQGHV